MMSNEELVAIIEDSLKKVSDPYQKGILAYRLMMAQEMVDLDKGESKKKKQEKPKAADPRLSLENAPNKKEQPAIVDLNPEAPLADTINTAIAEKHEMSLAEEISNASKISVSTVTPEDIFSEDNSGWAEKKLNSTELDDTWTERMLANNEMKSYYEKVKKFIEKGVKTGNITKAWLDAKAKYYTNNDVKQIRGMNDIPPKVIKILGPALMKAYMDEHPKQVA